ncbi:B12-binding domain-containing radical SAM protein [Candidatus Electrothrix laxa]
MKLVLLNPTPPGISSFGVRSISSYLREKGHQVTTVFFPGSLGLLKEGGGFSYHYSDEVIKELITICCDADLIGVSFFTNYLDRALQLTAELKKATDIPVIWGGIHASTKPNDSLRYADMVCVGEGEHALEELLERMEAGEEYYDVSGIWFKDESGQVISTPLRPLICDLDQLPFFDYSNEGHYILNPKSGKIEPVTSEIICENMPLMPDSSGRLLRTYRTMTDRGCPHKCTYCNVPTLKEIYKKDKTPFLRSRSPEHVIAELTSVIKSFPFIQAIHIFDDTFFSRPIPYIKKFAALYKEKIQLPMYCQASPNTLTEEKLSILIEADLVYVEMGIQTGSARIRAMYNRTESNAQILKATELLHDFRHHLIPPDYHIILDNPWENEEDTMETVRLLHKIPKPFGLAISSLVFYPKTGLYEKALKEGMIKDEMKEISLKPFYVPPKHSYVNFLIYLMTFPLLPKFVVAYLMRDEVVSKASSMNISFLLKLAYSLGETLRIISKGLRALLKGDMQRIALYFEKIKVGDPVVAGRKGK